MTAILPWHIIEIKYFIEEFLFINLSTLFLFKCNYWKMIHLLSLYLWYLSFQSGQTEYAIQSGLLPVPPFALGQRLLCKGCIEVG